MRGYVSRLSIVIVVCTIMISPYVFAGDGATLAELSLQVGRLNEQVDVMNQQSRNSSWFKWGVLGAKVATVGAIAYRVLNNSNGPWSQKDLEESRRRVTQHGKEIDQRMLAAHRKVLASMAGEHKERMAGHTVVVEELGRQIKEGHVVLAEAINGEMAVVGERQEKVNIALQANNASLEAMQTSVGNGVSGIAGIILQSQRSQMTVFGKAANQLAGVNGDLRTLDQEEKERRERWTVRVAEERRRLGAAQTGVKKLKEEMAEVLPLLEKREEQISQVYASAVNLGEKLASQAADLDEIDASLMRTSGMLASRSSQRGLNEEDLKTPRVLIEWRKRKAIQS